MTQPLSNLGPEDVFEDQPAETDLSSEASSRSEASTELHASIILQLYNGPTPLHIFDLELSAEDLKTVLRQVRNVTAFTYVDSYLSSVVRNLDKTFQRYAGDSLEDLLLQCVPNPMLRLKKALSPPKTPRPLAAAPVTPMRTAVSKAF